MRSRVAMRVCLLVVVSLLACAVTSVRAAYPCRFAPLFDADDLFSDETTQQQFAQVVAQWEGQMLQPNPCASSSGGGGGVDLTSVGYHAATGMTLDGHRLTVDSGEPLAGGLHGFTAASKESLHLSMLAMALNGNAVAATFLSPNDPTKAVEVALAQLALKVNTLDTFDETFPGFGGFLPWVDVSDAGLVPTPDFNSSVPSLDNGQMFWGAYAVAHLLQTQFSHVTHTPLPNSRQALYRRSDTTLAQRWQNVVSRMVRNALVVFYDASGNTTLGQFRTVSIITDRTKPIDLTNPLEASLNYQSTPGCGQCWLNDPYEGELFTNMAYLLGDWSWTGAPPNSVWIYKRGMLEAVNFTVVDPDTSSTREITVERGYWFSGHEKWKYYLNPYLSSSWNRRVFLSGEKARTWNSVMLNLPSGYASVSGTADNDVDPTGYFSDCGIPSIAFETVGNVDLVTPYSWGPLFLASPPHAYVWYHQYLLAARGQTCFGSLEGYNRTGSNYSPIVTWDTKITTLVALNGGIGDIVSAGLNATSVDRTQHVDLDDDVHSNLDLFVSVLDREWSRVFDGMVGEDLDFVLPNTAFPNPLGLDEFPSCNSQDSVCQCTQ